MVSKQIFKSNNKQLWAVTHATKKYITASKSRKVYNVFSEGIQPIIQTWNWEEKPHWIKTLRKPQEQSLLKTLLIKE